MSTKVGSGTLVALIACGGGSSPSTGASRPPVPISYPPSVALPVDSVFAQCVGYRDAAPEAYGLCLKQLVGGVRTAAEMETVCAAAGAWIDTCHATWVEVQSKSHRLSLEQLLAACGSAADCALQQLDDNPAADVEVQLELCDRFAGRYSNDCVGHALQRWALARPDPAEVLRVSSATTHHPLQVGTFVGMVAACQGTVDCPPGTGEVQLSCAEALRTYAAEPSRCGRGAPLPSGGRPR